MIYNHPIGKWYISGIYCQLGDYIPPTIPTTYQGNQETTIVHNLEPLPIAFLNEIFENSPRLQKFSQFWSFHRFFSLKFNQNRTTCLQKQPITWVVIRDGIRGIFPKKKADPGLGIDPVICPVIRFGLTLEDYIAGSPTDKSPMKFMKRKEHVKMIWTKPPWLIMFQPLGLQVVYRSNIHDWPTYKFVRNSRPYWRLTSTFKGIPNGS